jgi:hypothetical protein
MKVLFLDEASFYRQPTQASLWAERGRTQPRLRWSYRSNTLVRVAATLEAANQQSETLLRYCGLQDKN